MFAHGTLIEFYLYIELHVSGMLTVFAIPILTSYIVSLQPAWTAWVPTKQKPESQQKWRKAIQKWDGVSPKEERILKLAREKEFPKHYCVPS